MCLNAAVRSKLVVLGVVVAVVVALLVMRHGAGEDSGTTTPATTAAKPVAAATRRVRTPLPPTTIAGHVTRKANAAAIAGATVALVQLDIGIGFGDHDRPPLLATTDATGAWTAKVVPGEYAVTASAPGYLPASRTKLAIAANEARADIDLALDAGGTSLRGTVSDVGGGPIRGARVAAYEDSVREFHRRRAAPYVRADRLRWPLRAVAARGRVHADRQRRRLHAARAARRRARRAKPRTVDFALVPGGTITGQVVARVDRPASPCPAPSSSPAHAAAAATTSPGRRPRRQVHRCARCRRRAVAVTAHGYGYASSSPTTVELGVGAGSRVDGVRVYVDHALCSISGRVPSTRRPSRASPARGSPRSRWRRSQSAEGDRARRATTARSS